MKLKRVLLIVMASVEFLFLCVSFGVFRYMLYNYMDPTYEVPYYAEMMSYVNSMAHFFCAIFQLAMVDFVFCLGQKKYDKNMLGISIAMFAFTIVVKFISLPYLGLGVAFFTKIIMVDPSTGIGYYFLDVALTSLPFVGLAVASMVVKAKYLKTAVAQKSNAQQSN